MPTGGWDGGHVVDRKDKDPVVVAATDSEDENEHSAAHRTRTRLGYCLLERGTRLCLGQLKRSPVLTMATLRHPKDYRIHDVWADNLEEELTLLRKSIDRYPYVSMDTEFPGIVARPIGNFKTGSDYHFQTMRTNVDMLKIIQLGITLSDDAGNMPDVCTWQFNFEFSLQNDMYAPDSIELLKKSGIDFKRHEEDGINVETFGELMITSGMVLFKNVKWVSFHSGYDFGYLIKVLTCEPLPALESDFFNLLAIWFPCIYDIKHVVRSVKTLRGGLQEIAESLGVQRIGPQHQAGSDSLLTAAVFFRIRSTYFENKLDDEFYRGYLYGFSSGQNRVRYAIDGLNPASRIATASPSSGMTIFGAEKPY